MPAIYRHFDAKGKLLYVGCSIWVTERTKGHSGRSHWYQRVTRIDVMHVPTLKEARAIEKSAIQNERPLHNMNLNSKASRKQKELERILRLAGGAGKLAAVFADHKRPCTRQAVQQWRGLPEVREYQLREIKPEWFRAGVR